MHVPVMVSEVLNGLSLRPGGIYVDATLGLGGHTEAILSKCPEVKMVLGLDHDTEALEQAESRLAPFGDRVRFIHSNFIHLHDVLLFNKIEQVDGILMDLGISSFHLENSRRGFSFSRDEPLDMRMDTSAGAVTAANMVNKLPVEKLTKLIQTYGEERWAKRIAKRIYDRRKTAPILNSTDLAEVVANSIPRKYHPRRIHPATRTFQALRIAVNRELDNLKEALDSLPSCLRPEGRMCIISFHSLEDRLVKIAFREDKRLKPLTKKPLVPSREEMRSNPRARSAKLRIAQYMEPNETQFKLI
ncbi:MAG: 16S rRNA (cytosine(1402)-N(4))-methyltransferase RsmH [Deltaproteobacteria bacterium]|nr:16S rRNA (cytosine(1402)-N(4))-methyltransferase RsmH [Deltaproteobacteria bacterium]MBW1718608.1 16S rRNA (cytosine(1402)-N(4))-methyltransferase RsmH [Deltaproteobacteria bacterium]MBW1931624.1 16S rRNA (cytosine(1402)-N(4))-methyltransferase RsmH [Deltaproteobacteria bacterium]MBW1937451.1 16S rRNA (cytosine(1402)-N(4))-methyltransferase RsmH [Deltaproteobacteria bacterium]MBW1964196.1 16S rRNA (cytosine(1402)-N(4))-methyltransferase RsmH [Deltaproteobacteria bacterium]